jgi:hypothetical protein
MGDICKLAGSDRDYQTQILPNSIDVQNVVATDPACRFSYCQEPDFAGLLGVN